MPKSKKGIAHWWETIYGILAVILLFVIVFGLITFYPQVSEAAKKIWDPTLRAAGESGKILEEGFYKGLSSTGKEDELKSVLDVNVECNGNREQDNKLISIYKVNLDRARKLSSNSLEKQPLISKFSSRLLNCCRLQNDVNCILFVCGGRLSPSDKLTCENNLVQIAGSDPFKTNEVMTALTRIGSNQDVIKKLEPQKTQVASINKEDLNKLQEDYKKATTVQQYDEILRSNKLLKDQKLEGNIKLLIDSYKASIELSKIEAQFKNNCRELTNNLKEYNENKLPFVDKQNLQSNRDRQIAAKALQIEADCYFTKDYKKYYTLYTKLLNEYPKSLSNKNQIVSEFRLRCNSDTINQNNLHKTTYGVCKDLPGCYWVNTYDDTTTIINDYGTCRSCIDPPKNIKECAAYSQEYLNKGKWDWIPIFGEDEWMLQCEQDPCGFSTTRCIVDGVNCK